MMYICKRLRRVVVRLTFSLTIFCFSLPSFAVDFSLFGDVSFSKDPDGNEPTTFTLGQIDLIADQEISKSSAVTAEIVFENDGNGFEIDVERFSITRKITETLQVGVGRFHTPIGAWNTNFHHGSLLQDTITRPFFLDFEDGHGGILPVHIVGIEFNGEGDNWSYQAALANSNGINTENTNVAEDRILDIFNNADLSSEKSTVFRIAYRPNKFDGEFGLFTMTNNVVETGVIDALTNKGDTLFEQQIVGVDFSLQGEKLYFLSEAYQMRNKDNGTLTDILNGNISNGSYDASAFYAQLGYRMTSALTVVARHEVLDFDESSTYFDQLAVKPETRNVFAVSYKLEASNAIRLELSDSTIEGADSTSSIALQWFFLLF